MANVADVDVAERAETEQLPRDTRKGPTERLNDILRRGIASSREFQRAVDKMPGRMVKRQR